MKKYMVDVVIPVYKPDKRYKMLLEQLAKQTWPIKRIIVMNTGKEFYEEAKYPLLSNMTLTHILKEEFDHGGTRHQAAKMSDSDIIVFLTQDAIPKDEFLIENLVKAFENPSVAATYGRQLPQRTDHILEQITRGFNYPAESQNKTKADLKKLGIKTYFCSNVCCAYRRDVYMQLGGFPTKTIFNEDMIFAASVIKAGYTIRYEATAEVYHSHNYSGKQQFHRNFDLAVSQVEYPDVFRDVPSEGEGIRLVKKTASILLKEGKWYVIPKLIFVSGCKYMGYFLGKRYQKLPKKLVLKCSMNQKYWKEF